MAAATLSDSWSSGSAYDEFMGRWSRLIASAFLQWLAPQPHLKWLEIGCGTGALSELILIQAVPGSIIAIDPASEFIEFARSRLQDPRISFQISNATNSSIPLSAFDIVVSGLALNFIPEPALALEAMRRSLQPNGTLAFYVWDYAGKMEMLRLFWDAVVALDPDAGSLDEGIRFPMCHPAGLTQLCEQAKLRNIQVTGFEASMTFSNFDEYWSPFLGGQGPAPGYVAKLNPVNRQALEQQLKSVLPFRQDGSLSLVARAWAVRATP